MDETPNHQVTSRIRCNPLTTKPSTQAVFEGKKELILNKLSYLDANTLNNDKVDFYYKQLKIDETVEQMRPESHRLMIQWVLNQLE